MFLSSIVIRAMRGAEATAEVFVCQDLYLACLGIFHPRMKATEFLTLPTFLRARTQDRIDLGHVVGFVVEGSVEVKRHVHRDANATHAVTDGDGYGPVHELCATPEHRVRLMKVLKAMFFCLPGVSE